MRQLHIHISAYTDFCPSTFVYTRFCPKIEFFYCLHENAFPTHFLVLKYTLSIADKHPWILWFDNKVHKIPSPKFVHKSWQPTPKSALLVGHTIFFCNHTWLGQSAMFTLKLLLLKKNFRHLFVDGVKLLFFNTRVLGLPGAY